MPVHPQVQTMLDALAAADLPAIEDLTPAAAREQMEAAVRARGIDPTPVGEVAEQKIPGPGGDIRLRIYRPDAAADAGLPLLVYFHGGGHVIGSLDTHDSVARNLCQGAACIVASVDYRMGPEHRFPAAVDDSFAATVWLHQNAAEIGADPGRIAVAGDSAGANLAAVVALMARDAGAPALRLQLLVYPIADYNLVGESIKTYAKGYGVLTAAGMRWFQQHYLREIGDADDWRASPIKAADLSGVAPALVITAECDVLHDDGAAYATRLREAGVAVEHTEYTGMIHGFFSQAPIFDSAVEAQATASAVLKRAFA